MDDDLFTDDKLEPIERGADDQGLSPSRDPLRADPRRQSGAAALRL
jgi:hypothetical protein